MSKIHKVELTTRDQQVVSFECGEGESVLEAATRDGLTLPSMCREGSCGVCLGHCEAGESQLGDYNPNALSDDARTRGERLLCSTYPRSDLKLRLEQDLATIKSPAPVARPATVHHLEEVGGNVIRLQLKLEPDANGDGSASFEAGQYMELILPGEEIRRAYSIANTPNWDGMVEFYIRLQPGGAFSSWLQTANVGDRLEVLGPSGALTLNETSLSPRWFVAGGTGIAPILSMLRWMGEMGSMQQTRLYFGVRHANDLFALDEMETLKGILLGLKVELCLDEAGEGWAGFSGSPTDALKRDLEQAMEEGNTPEIYVCGPPGLIDTTEELARSYGVADSSVHSEKFLPA